MPIYGDFRYTEKENHIIIRAYCGDDVNVIVPESIKGKPVQEISPFAFVPEMDELEITGNDYKKRCSKRVQSIHLPDTILRLNMAFACCFELEEIRIPSHAEICDDCFHLCYALKAIHADPNNPNYLSRSGILYSKDGTTLLRCPPGHPCNAADIFTGVVEIGPQAFEFCANLTKVTIPETVTTIGSLAFANCHNLFSIHLHKGVCMAGNAHFWHCKALDNVVYYNTDGVIPTSEFYSCASLQNIEIGSKVRIIGEDAFSSSVALVHFNVPNGVTTINRHAFLHCRSLEIISLPRSVSRIHKDAFTRCGSRYYTTEEEKDIKTNFGAKPATAFVVIPGSKAEKFCIDQKYTIIHPQRDSSPPDWRAIVADELKDIGYLVNAFGRFLKKECNYSPEEAKFSKDIIDDPYGYHGVHKQYMTTTKICGTEYEIYFCAINDGNKEKWFTFYMLIDAKTINRKCEKRFSYIYAKKKYILTK